MRLIDADALAEELKKFDTPCPTSIVDLAVHISIDNARIAIKGAQTVDPVKHGHWITEMRYSEFYEMNLEESVCSCCGYNTGSALAKSLYDYCYKCGAKMDEEVEQ